MNLHQPPIDPVTKRELDREPMDSASKLDCGLVWKPEHARKRLVRTGAATSDLRNQWPATPKAPGWLPDHPKRKNFPQSSSGAQPKTR